jgi:hypothetical protein
MSAAGGVFCYNGGMRSDLLLPRARLLRWANFFSGL